MTGSQSNATAEEPEVTVTSGPVSPAPPKPEIAKPLSPRNREEFFRALSDQKLEENQKTVLKKIRKGRKRRKSWRPENIIKERWNRLPEKQQRQYLVNLHRLSSSTANGAACAGPKYICKLASLIITGEIPQCIDDSFWLLDLMQKQDALKQCIY